ncbi:MULTISPECIES: hypothetical protein [unclassified Paenibacillus]|uniref:hypothetical protein n=1 Tax=unclassified Paenibacillus TaxID=185978 RepID=UPI0011A7A9A9|nr:MULTISPECIES: hypothetical protein [Paenibacillaceae]
MRKIVIGILIVFLYCFPFVYFSMYQDFANHSMLGYLVMIVATSLLAFVGTLFSNPIFLVIGNILSLIISYYFLGEMSGNERWGGYFKPLSPNQLLILVSFLNLIPQLIAMKLSNSYRNKIKVAS